MMLEVSYYMGHIESAEENLDTILDPGNTLHIAYKAGILALDNSNHGNIATIKSMISQTQEEVGLD
ncbi:hypothetical protein [Cohnella cellulosilytica]|uniref:hypothetical protein n=1 Tax=Cohnella cellulosilytica TaxID=986710 RepID=UPI003608D9B6